jgi:hypothetical protein
MGTRNDHARAMDVANGRTRAYLTLANVVERYAGAYSAWTIREKARRGEFPHAKHPGSKALLFRSDWLDEWDEGAPLERRVTRQPGLSAGRIVKPRKAA